MPFCEQLLLGLLVEARGREGGREGGCLSLSMSVCQTARRRRRPFLGVGYHTGERVARKAGGERLQTAEESFRTCARAAPLGKTNFRWEWDGFHIEHAIRKQHSRWLGNKAPPPFPPSGGDRASSSSCGSGEGEEITMTSVIL